MLHHVRTKWLAGGGAVLLALSMTGLAAAATLVDDTTPTTLATFEDLNGNGIDDDCETAVTANADAVTLAMAAVDSNADGVISTTEAAQSGWVGGVNCNHGGYVSMIAKSSGDECDAADAPEAPEATTDEDGSDEGDHAANETSTGEPTVAADCAEDVADTETTDAAKDAARAACEAALAAGTPIVLPEMTHVELAQSDLVGGKNCNHGGAVSDANKAAKDERDAAKLAAREARDAAKALKTHGHKHASQ
jgi:hypothetical protein